MPIYLPVAGMSVDLFIMTGVGLTVGFLAGLLGVGGGFLVTPLLVVLGIPIDVAVSTGANQAVAASASGTLAQWQRGNVDLKMGGLLVGGGAIGVVVGVYLLGFLKSVGQIDLVVSALYVVLLGTLGAMMLIEGALAALRSRAGTVPLRRSRHHNWVHSLPLRTRFPTSKLYMSLIPPLALGGLIGLLGGIMGVGGGFVAVPIMVYLFGMSTRIVVGTSLLQVLATATLTTVLQAWANQSVDVVLAVLLMIGGVIGAQLGARAGYHMKAEQLRALLGLLILAVSLRMAFDLVITPGYLYTIDTPRQ